MLVTGTAGTGKTTVLRELEARGIAVIGIDEEPGLTTWINKASGETVPRGAELTEEFLSAHEWGCNIEKLEKIIAARPRPVVICGSCDNILEVMRLCEKSVVLVCEPDVFLSRIQSRTDNEFGQNEAGQQAILGYYQQYRNDCIAAGATAVDAAQSVDEVMNSIIDAFQLPTERP